MKLSLSLCLSAPLSASQFSQIYVVDGNQPPTIPYTHTNITSAVAAANAGDKILVKSLTYLGGPGAYAFGSTNETFPIVLRPGVIIEAYNSQPVYVLSSTPNATLFSVTPSASAPPLTVIRDLRLLGAERAIELDTSGGQELNVLVQNITFGRNHFCLDAEAGGGSLTVAVSQCQIFDNGSNYPLPAPAAQNFQVGLRFAARFSGTSSGVVHATVSSLTTGGAFSGMDKDPFNSFGDLHGSNGYSKLVSVETMGGIMEHPLQQFGDYFTRQAIPTVNLAVNGGVWDGKAAVGDKGWDVGLFAITPISGGSAWKDYYSSFDVSFNGTELRGFRESGIYAAALTETRGVVRVSGGARVKGTGKHVSVNSNDIRHSAVTLISREAYLAFLGDDSTVQSNLGNGILAYTPECPAVPVNYPQGLHLGLDNCDIHENGLNGLYLLAYKDKGTLDPGHGGIVGGTWDDYPINPVSPVRFSHLDAGSTNTKPMPELKQGEGYFNRCRISNNGLGNITSARHGIRAEVYGNGYKDENGTLADFAAISASIVNSFIWNHPGGGFSGDLDSSLAGTFPGPLMLTPFVHTTVVGNGDQAGYNIEVNEVDGPGNGTYYYSDINYALMFRIYNSIFERKNPQSVDFGTYFTNNLAFQDTGGLVPVYQIGMAGLRTSQFSQFVQYWTNSPTDFIGSPIIWTDLDAAQFFLDPGSPVGFINACPPFLQVASVIEEVLTDYLGDLRPTILQDRDKGAEEL